MEQRELTAEMIFARAFANWRTSHPRGTAREYADEMIGLYPDLYGDNETEYRAWKRLVDLTEAAH